MKTVDEECGESRLTGSKAEDETRRTGQGDTASRIAIEDGSSSPKAPELASGTKSHDGEAGFSITLKSLEGVPGPAAPASTERPAASNNANP